MEIYLPIAEQSMNVFILLGLGAAAGLLAGITLFAGSIYALDPDIPIDRQRLAIAVSGEVTGHRLVLDKQDIGPADHSPLVLPGPGAHRLRGALAPHHSSSLHQPRVRQTTPLCLQTWSR